MTPLLAQRLSVDGAFERLYRRHVGDVYRYALVVLRNPADAEDVTQTTFMNAYRAFQRGERPRTPQNWLISIAHNVCRQRFRQSARRPEEVGFTEEIGDGVVEEEQGPGAEDIQRALGHLAFNQRAALVMRELEGRSYPEIAEILGLSVSAVETLLFRARRALREQLEGSLTCGEAELAISKQMDGRLPRSERGSLRAHLRECSECAHFARSQRAQRAAFKTLGALPIPASLGSFFGGGGAAVGTGIAVKAAVMLAAGAVVAGTGTIAAEHRFQGKAKPEAASSNNVSRGAAQAGSAFVADRLLHTARPSTAAAKSQSSREPKGKALGRSKAKAGSAISGGARANQGRHLGQTKVKQQEKSSQSHANARGPRTESTSGQNSHAQSRGKPGTKSKASSANAKPKRGAKAPKAAGKKSK